MAPPAIYAALGSSFAAGPGISPIVDVDAGRSGRNYPHVLAGLLGARLTDATVSGATTSTILDTPQQTMTGVRIPPQLQSLPQTADLVTVTAGGNDLRYAGAMLFTAWNNVQPGGPVAEMTGADFADGIPAPGAEDIGRAAAGLAEIVERARARAPKARVLLVDYLTVVGDRTAPGPGIPFEREQIDAFRAIQSALELAYATAARRSGAELVTVSRASRDHALGSDHPWISPFTQDLNRTGSSFHPNATGMAAVAALIQERVTG
jgi:lysophospholipase L1-like esterase